MEKLFDKFLELLDSYLDGIVTKEYMELSFTEEEWEELYLWETVLIELIKEYDGCIDSMIKEYERKVEEDFKCLEDLERVLYLKKILDEEPSRLFTFREMVSYLEENWVRRINGYS